MSTEFRLSYKLLLLFLYLGALVLLIMLIMKERDKEKPAFSLSSSTVELKEGQRKVSFGGENLHEEINAVSVSALVDDESALWRLLDGNPVAEVAVQGDLLLVSSSERGKVLSIRVGKDGAPDFLGSVQLPGDVTRISIVGDNALVFMRKHAGVAVLDIQDPANLRLVEVLNETGLVTESLTSGSQVFYADIYKGLGRIDMQDGKARFHALPPVDSPWRISKAGSRLATATLKDKVFLYDVQKDSSLHETGSIEFAMNIRGISMTDKALAVALEDGSLHIYDLDMWPELKKVEELALPGSPLNLRRLPGSSKVVATIVSGGLAIVDLQIPAQPVLSGQLHVTKTYKGLAVQADRIYGGSRIGLEAFSVAAIENSNLGSVVADAVISKDYLIPKHWNGLVVSKTEGAVATLGSTGRKSDLQGRYLALHDDDLIKLFDLQDNGRFQAVGTPIKLKNVRDVLMLGDYLYILYRDHLQIRHCSDPDSMQIVAELQLPGVVRVLEPLDNKTMLVATRDEGVLLVDISNPVNPGLITSVAPQSHQHAVNITYDLLAVDGRVYISNGPGGVYVLDASRPEAPRLVQKIKTRGFAKTMEMVDGLLLVADSFYGLFVIDTTTYDVAVPIGDLPLPLRVDSMAVADNMLFVGCMSRGTMKLPLPRRITAVEEVTDERLTLSLGTGADRQQVYLYDNRSSVSIKVKPETLN